jgi:uncharacterized protein (TIGR02147 family)
MKKIPILNVFEYTNYRKFLEDYYDKKKAVSPHFSHRIFAIRAGYNSSGLLKDVIAGRTSIHGELIRKFIRGLALKRLEGRYFENLVRFNQARKLSEKNDYFENMMRLAKGKPIYEVHKGAYEYFSQWYYPAIRELLSIVDFNDDYKLLARSLVPAITQVEAKKGIAILRKYKFIKKNEKGFYKATQPAVTTNSELDRYHTKNFQRGTIDLARQALDHIPADQRNISTLTFSSNPKTMKEISADRKSVV